MQARSPDETRPRTVVGTYSSYREAQRAVDHLSDNRFPVERTQIVAEGLRIVEQVQGRLNWVQAALNGGFSGLVTGAFFGLLLGLFLTTGPGAPGLLLAIYGAFFGAFVGALVGLLTYALSGGRRDFYSASSMQAERYSVLADDEVAGEAARILATMRTESQPPGLVKP